MCPELAAEQCPLAPVGTLRRVVALAGRKGPFDKGLLPTVPVLECPRVAERLERDTRLVRDTRLARDTPLARPSERTR